MVKQELGETVQAMMEDDLKSIQEVLNQRPTGNYWILVHHKPTKDILSTGHRVIRRVIKVFNEEPPSLIGTFVFEVKDGNVVGCDVHLPDAPINWGLIEPIAGLSATPLVQDKNIAKEYFYNH
jgi:hypothetical protein